MGLNSFEEKLIIITLFIKIHICATCANSTVTLTIKTKQKTVLDNNTCTNSNTNHKSFSRLDFIIIMTDMTIIFYVLLLLLFLQLETLLFLPVVQKTSHLH